MKRILIFCIALLISSKVYSQELWVSKPETKYFQGQYFHEGISSNFTFTVNATNFQPDDTILVLKDMFESNETVDTLLFSDFQSDTLQWSYTIPQESFFMLTFMNWRTLTYFHAFMSRGSIFNNAPLLSSDELKESVIEYTYYDMLGRQCLPKGLVIRSDGKKIYFE